MSHTWDKLHARTSVVNALLTRIAAGDQIPAACAAVAGVWDHFDDETHLLRDLQQRWFHSLAASVDEALDTKGGDRADVVRRAYTATAARHQGLRRILDEQARNPALQRLVRREEELMACAAGVAHLDMAPEAPAAPLPTQRRRILIKLFG